MKVELRNNIFYIKDKEGRSLIFNKKYLVSIKFNHTKSMLEIYIKNSGLYVFNMSLEDFWNYKTI